jgi:amino acid permease
LHPFDLVPSEGQEGFKVEEDDVDQEEHCNMADHTTDTHKGVATEEAKNGVTHPPPVYEKGDTRDGHIDGVAKPQESWATRAGLTFRSFTRNKSHDFANVELERKMQPRHLNMIAIGGRYVVPF